MKNSKFDVASLTNEIKKLGGGFNIKNFTFENFCFFENFNESNLKEEELIEIKNSNEILLKKFDGSSKSFELDYIFEEYDQISDYFNNEEFENSLLSLFFAGFNNNILWLTSENPYEIDKKLIIEIVRNIHDKIRNETNFELSLQAFSIFYDKNEKTEFLFDYLNKKSKSENFKELNEIIVDDFKQTQNLIEKIVEHQIFQESNNVFVMSFKLYSNNQKYSEINYIIMPLHYILNQNKINDSFIKKYNKNLESELNLLLQKAKNLSLIDQKNMKSVLSKKTKITKYLLSSIFNNSKTFLVSQINFENPLISPELMIDLFEFQKKFSALSCNAIKNSHNLSDKTISKNIYKFQDIFGKIFDLSNKKEKKIKTSNSKLKDLSFDLENFRPNLKENSNSLKKNFSFSKDKYSSSFHEHNKENREINISQKEEKNINSINQKMQIMLKEIEDSFKTSYNETPFVNKPNSSLQQQFFEKTEEIRDPSPKFVLKTHKYDVVEMNIANEEKYVNPTSKEMKLKIALEETQQNFNDMESINQEMQMKIGDLKQENIELKAKYELEIQDYKNAMSNLELKYAGLSQNSSIHELIDQYENKLIKLELEIKNLRTEIDFLTKQENPGNQDSIQKKYKNLINSLNKDLIEKENLLKVYNKKKRESKNEKHQSKLTKEVNNVKDQQYELLNKKYLEQTHLIENLNKMINEIKEENKNFTHIIEEIDLEKENLQNQITIFKSMISSNNPEIKFSSISNKENSPFSKKSFPRNKLFDDMFNLLKAEFKKLNNLDYKDYDKYFDIIQQEYDGLTRTNNDLKLKHQELLDFLTKIQESIEKKMGKNDLFSKETNKTIRKFLLESVDINYYEF